MNEQAARGWLADRYGSAKLDRLALFVDALLSANTSQNLISKSSEPDIWVRHILDSAQLAFFAPNARDWLDVGSGAGLPGIVLAVLTGKPTLLVEPRRKRVEFLQHAACYLGLANVTVLPMMIERLPTQTFDAVTARAFTALPEILAYTVRLTHSSTIWVLPKGRSAEQELDAARQAWQGVFHVEHSLSDEHARIIVATNVRSR